MAQDISWLYEAHPLHRDSDGNPMFLGIDGKLHQFLLAHLKPGMRTMETGAGHSTLTFMVQGCDHVAIAPEPYLFDNIRNLAGSHGVDVGRLTGIAEGSTVVLPRLAATGEYTGVLDVALVDGNHAFPYPFVDFHYMEPMLKLGGVMIIDDTELLTGEILHKHLYSMPNWRYLGGDPGRFSVFEKLGEEPYNWTDQPYVVLNSFHPPIEITDRFRHPRFD